jgi:hypothetical protein
MRTGRTRDNSKPTQRCRDNKQGVALIMTDAHENDATTFGPALNRVRRRRKLFFGSVLV